MNEDLPTNTLFFSRPNGSTYDFYVYGELVEPEIYVEQLDAIRNMTENDILNVHINCVGGISSTAVSWCAALAECKAFKHISIEGDCSSAATFLVPYGDSWTIHSGSQMLVHYYSTGYKYGKGSDHRERMKHEEKAFNKLLREVYVGWFSDDEISGLAEGKDIWLDDSQIRERIQKLANYKQALIEADNLEEDEEKVLH